MQGDLVNAPVNGPLGSRGANNGIDFVVHHKLKITRTKLIFTPFYVYTLGQSDEPVSQSVR